MKATFSLKIPKWVFTPQTLSFAIIGIVSLILPIFFVPSAYLSFQFSKSLLLYTGIILAFAFYLVMVLRDGKFEFPKNLAFAGVGAVLLVTLASALLSGAGVMSLTGYGFEIGTFSFLLVMFLYMFLVSILFRSKEKIFYSHLSFFGLVIILSLYHIVRFIFGPDFLSLGGFTDIVSNTVGRWNDLGIFFGISVILSLVVFETLTLNKVFKWLLYSIFLISLLFLSVVNFNLIWITLGIFSLVFFVYMFSFSSAESKNSFDDEGDSVISIRSREVNRRVSYSSLIVLIVSAFFLISGNMVGGYLSNKLKISNTDVRPSWTAMVQITKETLKESPVLGAGPNKFSNQWLTHKPEGINQTIYWDTDFNYGVGLIPTFAVTTGILGLLAWVAFLVIFIWIGFKSIFYRSNDAFYKYLITSSFFVSLYLWAMNVLYVPSTVIVALTFFFTGLFLAAAYEQKVIQTKTISFFSHPRMSFLSVLVLIILLITSVAFGYLIFQKSFSSVYFAKGYQVASNGGDMGVAESYLIKAVNLSPNDIYYRSLAELGLARINQIVAEYGKAETVSDTVKQQLQQLLSITIARAQAAVDLDKTNYQNWISLGQVYASVPSLDVAYDNAKRSYEEALVRNPKNPSIYLLLAQLELGKNELDKAREYILKALEQKNNYTEAYFLLAQIEIQDKNVAGAISSVQAASIVSPTNPGVFFQLGLLQYDNGNYSKAIEAFEQAITLLPDYANAKYYLGLSYSKVGRNSEAVSIFTELNETNPNNASIEKVLQNLKSGKPAVSTASSKDDGDSKKLPIKESSPKETI